MSVYTAQPHQLCVAPDYTADRFCCAECRFADSAVSQPDTMISVRFRDSSLLVKLVGWNNKTGEGGGQTRLNKNRLSRIV